MYVVCAIIHKMRENFTNIIWTDSVQLSNWSKWKNDGENENHIFEKT